MTCTGQGSEASSLVTAPLHFSFCWWLLCLPVPFACSYCASAGDTVSNGPFCYASRTHRRLTTRALAVGDRNDCFCLPRHARQVWPLEPRYNPAENAATPAAISKNVQTKHRPPPQATKQKRRVFEGEL